MAKQYQILEQKDELELDKPTRMYVISVLSENGEDKPKTARVDIPLIFNKKLNVTKFNNPLMYFIEKNMGAFEKTVVLTVSLLFLILSITVRDLKFISPIILFFTYYLYIFVRTYKNNREMYFEENTTKTIDERKMTLELSDFIERTDFR
jgi:hypothetical protein